MRRPGSSVTRRATRSASSGCVHPGAMHPGVDLHEDAEGRARRDSSHGERLRIADVVDVDEDVRLAGQERRRASLLGRHELVRDEHVVRPGADHDDRLPDGRSTQPERTVLQLHPRDVGALVVLDVAPETGVQTRQARLHGRQVPSDLGRLHDERRGDDLVLAAPDGRPVEVTHPVGGIGDEAAGWSQGHVSAPCSWPAAPERRHSGRPAPCPARNGGTPPRVVRRRR